MRFFTTLLTALAIVAPVFATPTPLAPLKKYSGETTGRYIVHLKDGVSKSAVTGTLRKAATHDWDIINAFAGSSPPPSFVKERWADMRVKYEAELDNSALNELRASPHVDFVEEDGIMNAFYLITQTDAPWGIARLSATTWPKGQNPNTLNYTYIYDSSAGQGVDVYIVDTGVYTAHSTFAGRARWGATFGGYASADGNGHGTHCAGTVAGGQYGVAKLANIIAVKVLSDAGSGSVADIVSGLNYVASSASSSGRPSIVSMSLGGGATSTLDNAVASLTNAGIHVVVAAGNSNTDAGTTSPARAPSAITVGATTIDDARATFSNYGSVVDVFAPGQNIISAWIGSITATNNISGTSMATPHVAGLVAYLIGLNGNASPAAMATTIKNLALKSAITSIPSGTVNYLAHLP